MASKPTVTLTFAGDEKQLTKAFDRVGDAAKGMQTEVGGAAKDMAGDFDSSTKKMSSAADESSRRIRDSGDGVERWADKADAADTRAMGFRDTLTGVQDGLAGLRGEGESTFENLLLLGFGVGDLASGLANFLIPVMGTFITFLKTTAIPAVWSFTTALLSNPITWIVVGIAAVVAAIVLMITHWDKVKAVFTTVINWIGDRLEWAKGVVIAAFTAIGDAAMWVWNWIKANWPLLLGIITGPIGWAVTAIVKNWDAIKRGAAAVVGWIGDRFSWLGRIASRIGGAISGAFRSAFNAVAGLWNSTVGRISFSIPSWVPGIGGASFSMPQIPTFHDGGVVGGPPGTETLALLQAGETVLPTQGGGAGVGVSVTFRGDTDSAVATLIMRLIRSGEIQIAGVA